LTGSEQARLDALRRKSDVLTFRKGYAAVLLKRRGYQPLSPISNLQLLITNHQHPPLPPPIDNRLACLA
jgi:hypothetical protein